MSADFEEAARLAGEYAAERIRPGMRLGVGTGRTAAAFLQALAPRITAGLRVWGLCTSKQSEGLAASCGIQLIHSSAEPLDVAVDGADEFDDQMNLLKGGGGALLREKIVAASSHQFWVVAGQSKRVERLASTRPLPVEVCPFDWEGTSRRIGNELPCTPLLRGGRRPVRTDNGNFILDLRFPQGLTDPGQVASQLDATPGVMGHGLFLGMATAVICADQSSVQLLGKTMEEIPDS